MTNRDHTSELAALNARITNVESHMESQFEHGNDRMARIEHLLSNNSKATEEVREIVVMGKSLFKLMGYMGNGIKWVASVGVATAGIWYATKEWWAK